MKRVDTNAKHNCMLKIILNLLPSFFIIPGLWSKNKRNEMRELFVPVTVFD